MSLTKVTYTDNVTTIRAKNLNDIQDAILHNEEELENKPGKSDIASDTEIRTYLGVGS